MAFRLVPKAGNELWKGAILRVHILLLLAGLLGCGHVDYRDSQIDVDPELMPYYLEFIDQGISRGVNFSFLSISLQFGVQERHGLDGAVGRCFRGGSTRPHIIIDSEYWVWIDEGRRMRLVAHELGHCMLGRDHSSTRGSIMWWQILMDHEHDGLTMDQLWNEMFREFQRPL